MSLLTLLLTHLLSGFSKLLFLLLGELFSFLVSLLSELFSLKLELLEIFKLKLDRSFLLEKLKDFSEFEVGVRFNNFVKVTLRLVQEQRESLLDLFRLVGKWPFFDVVDQGE